MQRIWQALKSWEGMLLGILIVVVAFNVTRSPQFLSLQNLVNLFQLHIEKIIVALIMTFVIINAEIDLSVASIMGLSACALAFLFELGTPFWAGAMISLLIGVACGAFNGFWIAHVGLPSLVVTLAGLIGFRGLARVLLEDRSIGGFPGWFNTLGQQPTVGAFPATLVIFFVMAVICTIILQYGGFGRLVYVIGNNKEAARYSGVRYRRVKMWIFTWSGAIAALAGVLMAARLGAVRGNTAEGFELDIITMVLLGGVSIFGGSGSIVGVILAILIILSLRNGMGLLNYTANTQTGVIGILLILSVLVPNLWQRLRETRRRPYQHV